MAACDSRSRGAARGRAAALRGACSRTPTGSCSRSTAAPRPRSRSRPRETPETSQVGAPCPDHLINTKHRPLVVDFDPAATTRRARRGAPRRASTSTRPGTATTTSATSPTRAVPSRSTRRARVVIVPGVGIVTSAATRRARVTARPLPPRDRRRERRRRGGGLPLAERGRGVRDRVLAAGAVQARPGAAARRARRPDRGRHRRRQRHRPRDGSAAGRARRARRRRRPQRRERRGRRGRDRRGARRPARAAVAVDVTNEDAVADIVRRAVLAYGGPRRPRLDPPASRRARPSPRRPSRTGRRTTPCSPAATSSPPARRSRAFAAGPGGAIVFVGSKNALVAGANAAAYSSAKAASLHLAAASPRRAARGDPRQHGQPRRRHRGVEHLVVGVEGRAREHLRRGRGGAPGLLPRADDARRERLPGGRRRGDRVLRGPCAGKSTGNVLNVDGGVTAAYPR